MHTRKAQLPNIGDHVWLGDKKPVLVQPSQEMPKPSWWCWCSVAGCQWRNSGEAEKHQKGTLVKSTSLAPPPPLLPLLANFSTIRSFDGGGCPLVGGATWRGAGRNPSGGGWGGVGGHQHPPGSSIRQHLQRSLSRRSGLMANWEKGGTGQ